MKTSNKLIKRVSRYLLFKKLKPKKKSKYILPYVYNKNFSRIDEKKKMSIESDHLLSFTYS